MTLDLDDDEAAALVAPARRTLDQARYPLSPRYDVRCVILDKLDPTKPTEPQSPPIRSGLTPRNRPRDDTRCTLFLAACRTGWDRKEERPFRWAMGRDKPRLHGGLASAEGKGCRSLD